jgi:Cap4 SAVED domain
LFEELQALIEVKSNHFESVFDRIEHQCECEGVPSSSIGLHFVRYDLDGVSNWQGVIDLILGYITHYCFSAQKRGDLSAYEQNQNYRRARQLFRDDPKSGQPGELLIYLFIEAVLKAPQVLKKMPLTTNPKEERKGSDGVHLRMIEGGLMELIFAEAKLYADFGSALKHAFKSITEFYTSPTKALEKSYFTKGFSEIPDHLKELVISFFEGENLHRSREVYACLVGFDWPEYECLADERRVDFVKEFQSRYAAWAQETMQPHLKKSMESFAHKHLRLEFFFVPFESVSDFRGMFLNAL